MKVLEEGDVESSFVDLNTIMSVFLLQRRSRPFMVSPSSLYHLFCFMSRLLS